MCDVREFLAIKTIAVQFNVHKGILEQISMVGCYANSLASLVVKESAVNRL